MAFLRVFTIVNVLPPPPSSSLSFVCKIIYRTLWVVIFWFLRWAKQYTYIAGDRKISPLFIAFRRHTHTQRRARIICIFSGSNWAKEAGYCSFIIITFVFFLLSFSRSSLFATHRQPIAIRLFFVRIEKLVFFFVFWSTWCGDTYARTQQRKRKRCC